MATAKLVMSSTRSCEIRLADAAAASNNAELLHISGASRKIAAVPGERGLGPAEVGPVRFTITMRSENSPPIRHAGD